MSSPPPDPPALMDSPTLADLMTLASDSASVLQRLSNLSAPPTTNPASGSSSSTPHPPLVATPALRPGAPRLAMDRGRSASAELHPVFTVPSSTVGAATSGAAAGPTPSSAFPSLLSSLAYHRLPRPSPPTSNPRIVRSASHSGAPPLTLPTSSSSSSTARPSQSPTRRRQSVHSPSSHTHNQGTQHASLLRPRGPSYLSTLPSPGFPLPHYLSHSSFSHILRTGVTPDGPKPADYVLPTSTTPLPSAANEGGTRVELPSASRSRRSAQARHSDSDTSPTPTHRRARSHPAGGSGTPPASSGEAKDPLGKSEKPTLDPLAPLYIPTKWHATLHSAFLTLSPDSLTLTYTATGGNGDRDAATALASHPIPPHVGVYYYEAEVLDKGVNGYISIGICRSDMPLGRLPGWEYGSWGYHGDDGHAFTGTHADMDYGPKFATGDTIGCGVDYTTGTAFYTKNGLMIGPIFSDLPSHGPLYPCVGLRSPNESVRANFGQKDFMFDIDGYVRRKKDAVLRETMGRWAIRARPLRMSKEVGVKVEDEDEAGAPAGVGGSGGQRGRVVLKFSGGPQAEEEVLLRRRGRKVGAPAGQGEGKTPKKGAKRQSISGAGLDTSTAEEGTRKGHKASGSIASQSGKAGGGTGTATPERSEEEELRLALDALVLDYLAHQGFAGSVEALARESAGRAAEAGGGGELTSAAIGLGVSRPGSAMDLDFPVPPAASTSSGGTAGLWSLPLESIAARQQIMRDIMAGEIDGAMGLIERLWPRLLKTRTRTRGRLRARVGLDGESAIEEDEEDPGVDSENGVEHDGDVMDDADKAREEEETWTYSELSCRLECRKFVELVLACAASSAARSSPTISPGSPVFPPSGSGPSLPVALPTTLPGQNPPLSPPASPSLPAPTPPTQELSEAFAFGRLLHHRYSDAGNPEMRTLVSRTFSLLGFARPEDATGEVGLLVGPGAREELAGWVNEVILRGESHLPRPALARAWAQTKTATAQLAAVGLGKAAFLDVDEEFGANRRGMGSGLGMAVNGFA